VNFNSVSIDNVARMLEGAARSMRRWPWENAPRTLNAVAARWDIENEYHVQDMLWIILAPVFPDLDDEEWLKSLGQHHPRADLAIPSLELIVEVKFPLDLGRSICEALGLADAKPRQFAVADAPLDQLFAVWCIGGPVIGCIECRLIVVKVYGSAFFGHRTTVICLGSAIGEQEMREGR
jgi:hypothetical protein